MTAAMPTRRLVRIGPSSMFWRGDDSATTAHVGESNAPIAGDNVVDINKPKRGAAYIRALSGIDDGPIEYGKSSPVGWAALAHKRVAVGDIVELAEPQTCCFVGPDYVWLLASHFGGFEDALCVPLAITALLDDTTTHYAELAAERSFWFFLDVHDVWIQSKSLAADEKHVFLIEFGVGLALQAVYVVPRAYAERIEQPDDLDQFHRFEASRIIGVDHENV